MTFMEVLNIAAAIIASVGAGGGIVFGLSNWLGKVWADRLMQAERHRYDVQLAELASSLKLTSDERLASLQTQLDIAKQTLVTEHSDRIAIYRGALDLIAGIIAKIELFMIKKRPPLTTDELLEFETQRLRVYAYLAMHASQSVMDANDRLTDLVLEIVHDGKQLQWPEVRDAAIHVLNEVRKDVGIRPEPIEYRGTR